jgi:hypothetical protein
MECLDITQISWISQAYISYNIHILRTITSIVSLSKFQDYFLAGLILNVQVYNI